MSATPPAPSYRGPPLPHAAAPPPPPVRTAIVLVWVKLAVGTLGAALLLAVPGLREQLLAPAQDNALLAARPGGFVVGVVVAGTVVVALVTTAVSVVLTLFLRRGHRWVRVVALVLAALSVISSGLALLGAVLYALLGPDGMGMDAPIPLEVVTQVLVTALWVAIVVLLFLPASRWWLSERTAQRQRDEQQPRGPAERW